MKLIINLISKIVFYSIIFTMSLNIYTIFYQYENIKKFERTVIYYAQKNGGFCDKYDSNGNKVTDFDDFYEKVIVDLGLSDKMSAVKFIPNKNQKIQKKNKFAVIVIPKFTVQVPFLQDFEIETKEMIRYGYSHKYYKE